MIKKIVKTCVDFVNAEIGRGCNLNEKPNRKSHPSSSSKLLYRMTRMAPRALSL